MAMQLVNLDPALLPSNPWIRLHPRDNVVVARVHIPAGAALDFEGTPIRTSQPISPGHKMAVQPIREGEIVYKYGEEIGLAGRALSPGAWVHTHNLLFDVNEREYEFGTAHADLSDLARPAKTTFLGYPRADGRAGTRNYVAIVGASNCAAYATERIAAAFRDETFEGTGVDGVVPLPHSDGCGQSEREDSKLLRQTLEGLADHPNVGAALVVGLGCEVNQVGYYVRPDASPGGKAPRTGLTLQESGGTRRVVEDGVKAVRELIERTGRLQREPCPVSNLTISLECGGSDAFSGITANPGVGYCADMVVRQGGTACLGETTEIWGAEHLLTRRAANPAVGKRLLDMLDWYFDYVARFKDSVTFNSNPSPGNMAGGITNIVEKSLGAVAKGGRSTLSAVYNYAERITEKGFVFMNSPGYDPASVTGMVAGGCNICFFTTGRGSCFGFATAPVIKVASNSAMARHMDEDMDINAGTVADGEEDIASLGSRMYDTLLDIASGRRTCSERLGHREMMTWRIGPVL